MRDSNAYEKFAQLTVVADPPVFESWDVVQSVKAGSILLIKVGVDKTITRQLTNVLFCTRIIDLLFES